MSTFGWIVLGVAVAAAAIGILLIVRHRRYVAAVAARGWTRDAQPRLDSCFDLQAPPFGMGYDRDIGDLISGTTAGGAQFRAFKYGYRGAGPNYSGRVVALQLPFALPPTFVAGAEHRMGITGQEVAADGVSVVSSQVQVASAAFSAVSRAAAAFGQAVGKLSLSIDGNHLVATGAPRQPDELEVFLAGLEPVARDVAGLSEFAVAPPTPRFGFFGRPDWQLVGSDDSVLGWYPHTHSGYAHQTENLVRGLRDGIRMDAFTHTWKEDRVETYTDSQGNSRTRVVTDNKDEAILGFLLPFSLPAISIGGGVWAGRKVKFESIDFNKRYTVRAENPKFASDLLHPRMMEWMLATGAPGFAINGRLVSFEVTCHDLLQVAAREDTLHGFLPRIPRFVWQDLGLTPPPNLIG